MIPSRSHSQERSKHQIRYKRNRDFCEGGDTVKAAETVYLPRLHDEQDWGDYRAHLKRTAFFPAASKTLQGLVGLVFRKKPTLDAPDGMIPLAEYVTSDAMTLDDLAEEVFRESMVTNYTGLLVDHPTTPRNLSLADAIEGGFRPFISIYRAETILEIEHSVVRNRKAVSYVLLDEGKDQLRELELVDGIYEVRVHRLNGGIWTTETSQPERLGQKLGAIPFVLVTDGNDRKAPMDDICNLNESHWIHASYLSMAHFWLSAPVPVFSGLDDEGADKISIRLGEFINLESPDADFDYLEFRGTGIAALERHSASIEEKMRVVGLDMLGVDKNGVEAAEAIAMRKAAENSILASQARMVSRKISDALKWLWDWTGGDEYDISYSLSTDFMPAPLTDGEANFLKALTDGRKLSHQSLHETLVRKGLLPEALTFETELERIEMERIDYLPSGLDGGE
jgi:hypothetical protein